jgi:hypothetical protein
MMAPLAVSGTPRLLTGPVKLYVAPDSKLKSYHFGPKHKSQAVTSYSALMM